MEVSAIRTVHLQNLTEDEKEEYAGSMETIGGFLENPILVKFFRKAVDNTHNDGDSDAGPEATIERSLSGSKGPAIEYLNFIQAAQVFIDKPELIDNYLEMFLNEIDEHFKDDAQKKGGQLFIDIKAYYGKKLIEHGSYKAFKNFFSN